MKTEEQESRIGSQLNQTMIIEEEVCVFYQENGLDMVIGEMKCKIFIFWQS